MTMGGGGGSEQGNSGGGPTAWVGGRLTIVKDVEGHGLDRLVHRLDPLHNTVNALHVA